jgi:hypothetical protein
MPLAMERMHHVIDLHLEPHEASGLVCSRSDRLKERLGWSPLYWTILDDGRVQDCIAVIGQVDGTVEPTAGWSNRRLHCTETTATGHTDDGEAIAAHDGWIYTFGSGYGSKKGPLEPERSFVARFHEDDVTVDDDGALRVDLHVQQAPFVLHQVINDALRRSRVDILPPAPRYRRKFVTKARDKAVEDAAPWAWRLRHDDLPINIEGAEFTPDGTLLLGLRVPVTGDGNPIIVAIRGIDRLFDPAVGDPDAVAVLTVPGVGDRRAYAGIRDLHLADDGTLHLLVGDLDSDPGTSRLLRHHPEGGGLESAHWTAPLPDLPDVVDPDALGPVALEPVALEAEHQHTFTGLTRVEGIAGDNGALLYVSDEGESVRMRFFTDDQSA